MRRMRNCSWRSPTKRNSSFRRISRKNGCFSPGRNRSSCVWWVIARLEEKGLAKGIAVLLYGAPGTGKTESVLQWARESGRDVVHVDISAAKSMWYGESEKIVKDIFTRYKRLCRRSQIKPILLFNEADAIFSKRKAVGHGGSIDQKY